MARGLPEGSIYRRNTTLCKTCGNKRLLKTSEREACEAARHKLFERVSPIWWVSYKTKDGWRDESSKSRDKIDAQRLLRDRKGAIDQGTHAGRFSFEDGKKAALLHYKLKGRRSIDVFERRLTKHVEPVFAGWQLADITNIAIAEFQARRLDAGASPAEINRECDVLSKMFTLAMRDKNLFARPHIEKLPEPKARKGFVSDAEYLAIRDALEPHMRGVWAFQFLTGWRSTEVLGLKWEHIQGDQIRFTEQTKGDETARPFPITKDIQRVLDDQRKLIGETKTPFVFCFVKGKKMAGRQISYNGWLHAFNDAREVVDVRKTIIPHDCRRTAIDRMERLGVARSTAMVMVGHKTESVYRRYAITSARTLEDAGTKLASIKLPAPKRKR